MRDETVARSYAATLFELAQRHEGLEEYGFGIETVARLIDEDPKFRRFLDTPRIADGDKKAVVRKAFTGQLPGELVSFLLITIDKRRQRLLRDIAREFHAMVDEHEGRARVEVTVARDMDEATSGMLTARLSKLLAKTAITHVRVKPEIVGGVIVRAGDTIYDGSIRRRLDGMRRQMMKAPL
ncbi:MAG: ATP synthase F1 subunit delta [Gemmatimonadetes bacterium]|nr:ATP synthase F1 subunit delta [Gemmatimonadota bacterium]